MHLFFHRLTTRTLPLLCLLLVSLSLTACDDDDTTSGMEEGPATVVEVVTETANLSTLATAVQEAGLISALEADGPFTVFAPSNQAFTEVTTEALLNDQDLLTSVLQFHVVSGAVLSSDLQDGQTITTLQGDQLTVRIQDNAVRIGGATVTEADLEADNGVVHVVDRVLLANRTAAERVSFTTDTQTLTAAVGAANLADALADQNATYTIFAPVESAFDGVDVEALLNDTDALSTVLQYHVIAGSAIRAEDIQDGATVATLQGDDLTFTLDGGNVFVNGDVRVRTANLPASNGVIHLIEGVLMPPAGQEMQPDVTVTIDNVGASAWVVTDVQGASGVATQDENNATITLTPGTRYRFINNGGSAHPLGFQDANDAYLLREGGSGSFEDDGAVSYVENSDGVTFTVTQALADEMATYNCTVHASMEGSIATP